MATNPSAQQYILLPSHGLRASATPANTPMLATFLSTLGPGVSLQPQGPTTRGEPPVEMRVIDAVHEDGAKLVEMPPDSASALRQLQPGVRVVPVVYFHPALAPRPMIEATPKTAGVMAAARITIRIVSKKDGTPIPNATVVAFTDFQARTGAQGTTDAKGQASLSLGASRKKIERLYVYPPHDFWGALKKNINLTSGTQIALAPVDLSYADALRHFYGSADAGAGKNVRVGVIDTGVATHPDLLIDGGANTVPGENPSDFGDNGEGHGTHVAGIIGAHGAPPTGMRGLAPGVTLRSYRVFGQNSGSASNYAILKAIDQAVADGCDLLNMSLGGGDPDEATRQAISDARASGTLVIVAAGNDDRGPVSFPALESLAIAVSALGRKGTFPAGTTQAGDALSPFGTDKKDFIASFSNIGPEIDLTAPGVGIVSTYPGGYAPLDGTSMACPAVTGFAARLLSGRPDLLSMPRDQARSDAFAKALLESARTLGFQPIYEGRGLPC